ncbi:MAG: TetR/AcrR family transcriptional regulator [Gemmatimonadetes bacterium]|nr:TetR/AcrR family transcriptional regulator [Gemmatimonadota bacterium]MBT8405792.1 TetR/AcrR family transcriptional regulator [Gemmatimonadota bacterium]NNK63933.1 TetR/AcrR family transcriptional regulator [Gemmatimonadota bacterium]
MALPRFQNLHSDRREHILEVAGHEFADHGFAGASVNRILDRAGLSKGVLYYYFEDKADLFETTLEAAVRHLFEERGLPGGREALGHWVETLDADGFWDALREMSRQSLGLLRSDLWYVRLARAYPRIRQEPAGPTLTGNVEGLGRGSLEALLSRGRALGVVRSDLPLDFLVEVSAALDHAGDRWIVERLDAMDDGELAALMDARMDMLRDMLDAAHVGWEE